MTDVRSNANPADGKRRTETRWVVDCGYQGRWSATSGRYSDRSAALAYLRQRQAAVPQEDLRLVRETTTITATVEDTAR
jgi:hypothetical protein